MRILLINPASDEPSHHELRDYLRFYFPELTLPYVAALTPENIEVELVDEEFHTASPPEDADLVLIIGKTHQANRMYSLAKYYRTRGAKVILGGPHVSAMQEEAGPVADAIIVGGIVSAWRQVIEDLISTGLKSAYSGKDSLLLSDLPMPKRDLLKKGKYKGSVNSIITSVDQQSGSVYEYDDCMLNTGHAQYRSIASVVDELNSMDKQHTVLFRDSNLASDHGHLLSLLHELKTLKRKYIAKCGVECFADKDIVNEFRESGCEALVLNIVTFNPLNAEYANQTKISSISETIDVVRELRKNNILVYPAVTIGFDDDTTQTLNDLFEFVKQSEIDKMFMRILTPMPGSSLFRFLEVQGRILTKNWNNYDTTRAVFRTAQIDPATLEFTYESLIRWIVRNRFRRAIIKGNT